VSQPNIPRSDGDARLTRWLFAFVCCAYLLSAGGHFYASDDQQKFEALQALVERGALNFPGGWGSGLQEQRVSWFTLGASLAMFPGYALGSLMSAGFPGLQPADLQRFFISFQNCIFSAGLVSLFYYAARTLDARPGHAVYGALALGFGTVLWPYAKTSWSEPLATLALFAGAVALWHQMRGPQTTRWAWCAGVGFALAVSIRLEFLLAAVGMLLAAAWSNRARPPGRVLLAWLLPLAVALSIHGIYEWLRYGAVFSFPNYWLPQSHLTGSRLERSLQNCYLFFVSPNQGIFWYSPALLAGVWGWASFQRHVPNLARLFLWGLMPLAVFYMVFWGTSSWAWGLRYAYVFVPFSLLPLIYLLRDVRRYAVHGLFALGVSVQLLAWPFDFGYLYRDALDFKRGDTIQLVRLKPEYAPLRLAWQRWPAVVQGTQLAWGNPSVPSSITKGLRQARSQFVPDAWWLLYRCTPLPRAPLSAAWIILVLIAGWSALRLQQLTRRDAGA
jgi:hypothetical protein